MTPNRPAWSRESVFLQIDTAVDERWSPEWAMGGATGAGVRVAVVDSGIDADHPMLGNAVDVEGAIDFSVDADGSVVSTPGPHDDVFGHGTACAGIIHALAPEASITSVRVLGPGLRGKAAAFHAGLQWAVDQEFDVINLSLGASKRDWAFPFHEVCDRAYFANSFIVTAANNIQRASFPSLYASVTSVACNTSDDPLRFHFNPEPPTEFLARGIDVEVPWLNGETTVTTGNSFAAPHIAGFAALIRSKHPTLRPFHIKSLLWACAANVRENDTDFSAADRRPSAPAPSGRGTIMLSTKDLLAAPGAVRPTATHNDNSARATRLLIPDQAKQNEPNEGSPSAGSTAASYEADPIEEIHASLPGFTVSGLLSSGAWGSVYEGTNEAGEAIAIRRVEQALVGDERLIDRFVLSVRAAAELQHPHILPIHELVELDRSVLVVMPRSASHLGELNQPVELADVCVATLSLLAGLQVAHRAGVFHGDLRPQNALIDQRRRVVVSDAGLAAPLQSNARTMVQFAGEDWAYRAPELASGGAVGAHTDVYAVGAIAYRLLTGQPPRPVQPSIAALIAAASSPTPPTPLPASVPEQIATTLMYSLVHEAPYRWANVSDFASALSIACTNELGSEWAYRSQFILEHGRTAAPGYQTGTVIRARPVTDRAR